MVTPIPTFTSQKTLTPVGPASFSGNRAMAQALGDVGKVFDQVGDYAYKKAFERMEREQTILGQDIARSKGFDADALPDPRSAADKIYRDSALQTYAIQVESDITTHLNGLFITNQRNPGGFAASADAYVTKTVDALPSELKNGASKLAMSMATQKHFQLQAEYQRRVIAESEQAEKSYLHSLSSQVALAKSPEEKQVLIEKIRTTLKNSKMYYTEAGQQAALKEALDTVFFTDTFNRVTSGEQTPMKAIESLQALGIVPDSQMVSQIYSSANQRINFAESQINLDNKRKQQLVAQVEDAALMAVYDARQGNQDAAVTDTLIQSGADALIKSGASVMDVMQFQSNAKKVAYGDGKGSPEVRAMVSAMVFEADPAAPAFINRAVAAGGLTVEEGQRFQEDYIGRRAQIRDNPNLRAFLENDFVPHAPLMTYDDSEIALIADPKLRALVAADKAKARAITDRIVLRSQDVGMDTAINEERANLRANSTPVTADHYLPRHINKPYYGQVERLYKSPDFSLWTVNLSGRKHIADPETLKPDVRALLKGPWTRENAQSRVRLMILEEEKAQKLNETLYDADMLRAIEEDWE